MQHGIYDPETGSWSVYLPWNKTGYGMYMALHKEIPVSLLVALCIHHIGT